ncbi:hypothetical protein Hanom_Chr07g00640931 [Helianthus anomalus]
MRDPETTGSDFGSPNDPNGSFMYTSFPFFSIPQSLFTLETLAPPSHFLHIEEFHNHETLALIIFHVLIQMKTYITHPPLLILSNIVHILSIL